MTAEPILTLRYSLSFLDYVIISRMGLALVLAILGCVVLIPLLASIFALAEGARLSDILSHMGTVEFWRIMLSSIGSMAAFVVAACAVLAILRYTMKSIGSETLTRVSASEIASVRDDVTISLPTKAVKRVFETSRGLAIQIASRGYLLIPRHAFASDNNYREFVQFMRGNGQRA